jgi:hypothetical protein
MPMSGSEGDFTHLSDVIVPEVFNPYVREQTTFVNAFFRSGIIASPGDLTFGDRGGVRINMPFWKALHERAQLLDDHTDLDVKKIEAGDDIAVQHARALVYGSTDLAAALAGSDPMLAIGDGVAENWSYELNHVLLASLVGAMGSVESESPPINSLDISSLSGTAGTIDGHTFIDALQTLGDAKGKIVGMAVHSAVDAHLAKNDLITFTFDSQGQPVLRMFMGKVLIVDDILAPDSGGVYTSYLFGPGAIGWGEGRPKVATESRRDPLIGGGQEYLVSRRHFVMHPRGIAWTPTSGVPAKTTPSDAELTNTANWTRVYQPKNIRIVSFRHQI